MNRATTWPGYVHDDDPRIGARVLAPPEAWDAEVLERRRYLWGRRRQAYGARPLDLSVTGARVRLLGVPPLLVGTVVTVLAVGSSAEARVRHLNDGGTGTLVVGVQWMGLERAFADHVYAAIAGQRAQRDWHWHVAW